MKMTRIKPKALFISLGRLLSYEEADAPRKETVVHLPIGNIPPKLPPNINLDLEQKGSESDATE